MLRSRRLAPLFFLSSPFLFSFLLSSLHSISRRYNTCSTCILSPPLPFCHARVLCFCLTGNLLIYWWLASNLCKNRWCLWPAEKDNPQVPAVCRWEKIIFFFFFTRWSRWPETILHTRIHFCLMPFPSFSFSPKQFFFFPNENPNWPDTTKQWSSSASEHVYPMDNFSR